MSSCHCCDSETKDKELETITQTVSETCEKDPWCKNFSLILLTTKELNDTIGYIFYEEPRYCFHSLWYPLSYLFLYIKKNKRGNKAVMRRGSFSFRIQEMKVQWIFDHDARTQLQQTARSVKCLIYVHSCLA